MGTVPLLKEAMITAGKSKFLIHGFPPNLSGVAAWDELMKEFARVAGVIILDCSTQILEKRCLERGKLGPPSKQTIEAVQKRLQQHEADFGPTVELCVNWGVVSRIDASNTQAEVWRAFDAAMQGIEHTIEMATLPDQSPRMAIRDVLEGGAQQTGSAVRSSSSTKSSSQMKRRLSSTFNNRAFEVKEGELQMRTLWRWVPRYFQLKSGHLRWWENEAAMNSEPPIEPMRTIKLVASDKRWRIDSVKGDRIVMKVVRASAQACHSDNTPDTYTFSASSVVDAMKWAEAIYKQITYVDLLSIWPMPVEGRQATVTSYGIVSPE